MQAKPPYRGYTLGRQYLSQNSANFHDSSTHFALGINGYFSFDSRYWGPVPENLVGRRAVGLLAVQPALGTYSLEVNGDW